MFWVEIYLQIEKMDEIGVKSRLRTALEAYNENPTSLAKKFGVNQKTLNNQINSDTAVSLSTILLMSEALPEISLEWLLRGRGDMSLTSASVVNSHNVNSKVNSDNNTLPESFVRDMLAEKDKQIQTLLEILKKWYLFYFSPYW